MLQTTVGRGWWILTLRGALAILIGLSALAWPGFTLETLVLVFGAYALFDGIFALTSAVTMRHQQERWGSLLMEGLIGIAAGAATFLWPGVTTLVMVYMIGAWAVVTGVLEIVAALRLRRIIEGEFLLVVAGALSILFGGMILLWPAAGVLALMWLLGTYAILFGVLMISLSLRVRTLHTPRPTTRTVV